MECDFLDGSPRPLIRWFMNDNRSAIREDKDQNRLLLLEGGRYLFIRVLTMEQNRAFFYCEAINTLLRTSVRSNTVYHLGGELPINTLETYLGDRAVTVKLGEVVDVVYAAAGRTASNMAENPALSCRVPSGSNISVVIANDVVARFTGLGGVESDGLVNFTCNVLWFSAFIESTTVRYFFIVTRKHHYVRCIENLHCLI